jgi:hypothetical protein
MDCSVECTISSENIKGKVGNLELKSINGPLGRQIFKYRGRNMKLQNHNLDYTLKPENNLQNGTASLSKINLNEGGNFFTIDILIILTI